MIETSEKPTAFSRRDRLKKRRQQQQTQQADKTQSKPESVQKPGVKRSRAADKAQALKSKPTPGLEPFSRRYVRSKPTPVRAVAATSTNRTPGKPPKKLGVERKTRSRSSSSKPILYGLRLLIVGVGIGAIAGTLLSILDPASRITAGASQSAIEQKQPQQTSAATPQPSGLKLSQEIMPLKISVQQLAAKNPTLMPGVFFVDLDTGNYLDLNSDSTFSAASTIKVPVLVAFFQDVDAGKIRLDEMLTLEKEMIGGGSGEMQYRPLGTKFTALEVATKMITISDNTATNMLISRLGGAAAVNQRFRSWGLTGTEIRNLLPDLEGTNATSPRDLAQLMALVNQGDLMSLRSRDRLLDIMRRTVSDSLLPRGLGEGATIAHKTGDIGSMVGDVGLVDMPNGKRYIAVVMVKRPHNDARAQNLIREVSRVAYQSFLAQPQAAPLSPGVAQPSGVTRNLE